MDLLDWMAGQALAGIYGYISECQPHRKKQGLKPTKHSDVADDCYTMASAMLAEKARLEADHSEDTLGKVAALEAANRELVEALEKFLEAGVGFSTHPVVQHDAVVMARAALAKAKGVA